MSPIVTARAIDSLHTRSEASLLPGQTGVDADGKSAFVLYVFRVPGSRDFCLSTFKVHEDVVTALDILLAAYYVRVGEDEHLQLLRGDHCMATLYGSDIEVKIRIDDPASKRNNASVVRKPIENQDGSTFNTAIHAIDRKSGHSKSISDGVREASTMEGLNYKALAEAAAAIQKVNERQSLPSPGQMKEKFRTARRSAAASDFKNQWGDRCVFYTNVTGQDLRCDQVPQTASSSTDSVPISELRFNLPAMMSKIIKKRGITRSENDVALTQPVRHSDLASSREKHVSMPSDGPARTHMTTRSEDLTDHSVKHLDPVLYASSNDAWPQLSQPDLGSEFSSSLNIVPAELPGSPLPPRSGSFPTTSDEQAPPLPARPSHALPLLPPRQKGKSVPAGAPTFAVKRKAVNRVEDTSPSRPPIPPRHQSANSLLNDPPRYSPPAYSTRPSSPERLRSTSSVLYGRPASPLRESGTIEVPVFPSRFPSPTRSPQYSPRLPNISTLATIGEGRLDLTLGQEALGGGFRGQQAKLGKLLIYPDGYKMLDLVVAANMVMFWRAWKGGKSVGRERGGSMRDGG